MSVPCQLSRLMENSEDAPVKQATCMSCPQEWATGTLLPSGPLAP